MQGRECSTRRYDARYRSRLTPGLHGFIHTTGLIGNAGPASRTARAIRPDSFATNAISLGVGVKAAMDAGRWKSSTVFLETYVHSENAGRLVADRFNSQRYANL